MRQRLRTDNRTNCYSITRAADPPASLVHRHARQLLDLHSLRPARGARQLPWTARLDSSAHEEAVLANASASEDIGDCNSTLHSTLETGVREVYVSAIATRARSMKQEKSSSVSTRVAGLQRARK